MKCQIQLDNNNIQRLQQEELYLDQKILERIFIQFQVDQLGQCNYLLKQVLVGKSGLQVGTFSINKYIQDENEFVELDDECMLQTKYLNIMKVGQIGQGASFDKQLLFVRKTDDLLHRETFSKFLQSNQKIFNLKNLFLYLMLGMMLNQIKLNIIYNTQIYKEGEQVKQKYYITQRSLFFLDGQFEITKIDNQNESQKAKKMQRSLCNQNQIDVGMVNCLVIQKLFKIMIIDNQKLYVQLKNLKCYFYLQIDSDCIVVMERLQMNQINQFLNQIKIIKFQKKSFLGSKDLYNFMINIILIFQLLLIILKLKMMMIEMKKLIQQLKIDCLKKNNQFLV
ncbi:unnamed protein product [Paramecium sonneborni]|uniref:Uncharacterized protein n=1 Tax=Paramecium sonneborni TaxID=65129 RepID=A0A8S1NYA6_9CILI|nr:unnamed protein product [Paramecium sonneborni]